jgi:hypothetical protein
MQGVDICLPNFINSLRFQVTLSKQSRSIVSSFHRLENSTEEIRMINRGARLTVVQAEK